MALRDSTVAPKRPRPDADAAIIGAGFAGLYAHYRLRGSGLVLRGFEAGPDVGGTWYWNAYPGARCDVESMAYCYSFSDELLAEWRWSERFAAQPEILAYARHVADRFDLRRDIAFDTRVTAARFDEENDWWVVETDKGERSTARFLIAASGCLSERFCPDIPGLGDFAGKLVQTSAWPQEGVDLAGKRVGIVGTGSSAIQAIPVLAEGAAHLTVFQRTPSFSLPARNRPIDPDHEAAIRHDYPSYARASRDTPGGYHLHFPPDVPAEWSPGRSLHEASETEREAIWDALWDFGGTSFTGSYTDLTTDEAANERVSDYVRAQIRKIVRDPQIAERLCPKGYPFAAKRLCLDTDYFATFNRDNVTLVDVRADPVRRVVADGIETGESHHLLDVLVLATGFDAVTGPLLRLDPVGAGGLRLADAWADGPRTYLGLMVARFPNLFTVTGPGSPSVLTNMIPSIEQHIDWIADCLEHMRSAGKTRIEPTEAAQDEWIGDVEQAASHSLFIRADSWYMGANIPGKKRMMLAYMGGLGAYGERIAEVAASGYRGFEMSAAPGHAPAMAQTEGS